MILRRNLKSRFIRIRVDNTEGVVLIVPGIVAEQAALRFALEKKEWIAKSLRRRAAMLNNTTVFTEQSSFKTRYHLLLINKHEKNTIKSVVSSDKISIWYPSYASVEDARIQTVVRRAIEEAWRIEAKFYLPQRITELARKYQFLYNSLSVKKAKTRWGSCSSTNNINLNLQLMRLPDHLIDYVILHELMHTREKNHQRSFWNALEEIMPGAKKYDKELNKYNLNHW